MHPAVGSPIFPLPGIAPPLTRLPDAVRLLCLSRLRQRSQLQGVQHFQLSKPARFFLRCMRSQARRLRHKEGIE